MATTPRHAVAESGDLTAPSPALRNLAYEGFRQQIIEARIHPGQFVSQRQLVELLQMPLAAVRELIPRLEGAGLIKTVPKRGLQIASVDLKLIRNAFQIRAMIEREAVHHFAATATPALLERLIEDHRRILERALAPHPDADLEKDAKAVDWALHDLMVDGIGNEILSELYRVNSLHVRLIRFDADAIRPLQVVPAMHEHLQFLKAIQQGDRESAVRELMAHIEASKQRVIDVLMHST